MHVTIIAANLTSAEAQVVLLFRTIYKKDVPSIASPEKWPTLQAKAVSAQDRANSKHMFLHYTKLHPEGLLTTNYRMTKVVSPLTLNFQRKEALNTRPELARRRK